MDSFGELKVCNLTTGASAVIKFKECGLLGGGRWEVSGEILNAAGEPRMSLRGKWNEKVEVMRPAGGGTEARPISHWSPYDRVGVVNADP